jgi:rubredoxin
MGTKYFSCETCSIRVRGTKGLPVGWSQTGKSRFKNTPVASFCPDCSKVPIWPNVSDEVRLRLYSLLNSQRRGNPPLMEDIEWLAAYCEL